MKSSRILICALVLVFVASCKTQEDIRRERTVETLNEEVQQTKKNAASGNSRFNALEDQIANLTGQLEETNHNRAQAIKENQSLNERINTLEEANKKQVEYLKALTEKVNNQSGYIEEVIASLAKLSEKSNEPAPAAKSKKKVVNPDSVNDDDDKDESTPITFEGGLKKFNAKDFDEAKSIFDHVASNKKSSKKNREGATYYLGMIEYKNKNYESAKVLFSKVFSDSPNSSFAPQSLLQLGKTFNQLKSKEEASMTFDELISRFPKSKEAAEAAKLKK